MKNDYLINQLLHIEREDIRQLKKWLVDYIYSQCKLDADDPVLKEWKRGLIKDYINIITLKIEIPPKKTGILLSFGEAIHSSETSLFLCYEEAKIISMFCELIIDRINSIPLIEKEIIVEKNIYLEKTPLDILEVLMKLIGYTNLYIKQPDMYKDSIDNSIEYITHILGNENYEIINYSDHLPDNKKELLFDYLIKDNINEVIPQYPALIKKNNGDIILKGWIYVPQSFKLY